MMMLVIVAMAKEGLGDCLEELYAALNCCLWKTTAVKLYPASE